MPLNINKFRPLPKSLSLREELTEQNVSASVLCTDASFPFSLGERVRDRGRNNMLKINTITN